MLEDVVNHVRFVAEKKAQDLFLESVHDPDPVESRVLALGNDAEASHLLADHFFESFSEETFKRLNKLFFLLSIFLNLYLSQFLERLEDEEAETRRTAWMEQP